MPNDQVSDSDFAVAALLMFPREVRASVLSRGEFRQRFSLGVDAVIRLKQTGAEFSRSTLFESIRQVLAGVLPTLDVAANDGLVWHVTRDRSIGIMVRCEENVVSMPECACLSPDRDERLQWFSEQTRRVRVTDTHFSRWLTILSERPLDDEELDDVVQEFRLTPVHVASTVAGLLRRGSVEPAGLVPSDVRYFDRLVGEPTTETDLGEFISRSGPCGTRVLDVTSPEDLKAALLLSAQSSIGETLDLNRLPRDEVALVFEWLAKHGDRISQVGSIECGLRFLRAYPELESSLTAMVTAVANDRPEDSDGRLSLLSSLVALVEGEVARRQTARERAPFWRRLASIAHASVIEREAIAADVESASLADWAFRSGGALYYMQSLVDLRKEPRWFPDFISPQQLKSEFIARVTGAAERYRENVPEGLLSAVLWGPGQGTIQSQLKLPSAFLPGPLEGGAEAIREIPPHLEAEIRRHLEAEELTSESFSGLVNCSLIFKIGSQLSELAAQGLRRVGYQLRKVSANDDWFPLLHGLAMVSAVTRSKDLADEVRVLARGARRRGGKNPSPAAIAKTALVAAAAYKDPTAWSNFLGAWLCELAFVDMTRDEALDLQRDLYTLFHVEPTLWETCGRAEAAVTALVSSFPHGDTRT